MEGYAIQGRIKEVSEYLRSVLKEKPEIALITGTGLEKVTGAIREKIRIPYQDIPHFPKATAEGHKGMLLAGKLSGKPVIAMQGRFHLYEGYTPAEICFPVRVMTALGITYLFITSAAGGGAESPFQSR